jgi:hypothetical protein
MNSRHAGVGAVHVGAWVIVVPAGWPYDLVALSFLAHTERGSE